MHPDKFCILGNFDLRRRNRLDIVRNWRQRPGMLGFRFTFNQPHQQVWWDDGSLIGSRPRAKGRGCRLGCWRAVTWRPSATSPSGTPGSSCTSTITGAAAVAVPAPTMRRLRTSARCWRSPNIPMSASSFPAHRAVRANPTPIAIFTDTVRQIFDAFGPQRCFWGTDITRMPCSYRQCVTMFTEELPWLKGNDATSSWVVRCASGSAGSTRRWRGAETAGGLLTVWGVRGRERAYHDQASMRWSAPA